MKYFITGIGTDVGKTVVSAILTEALQADYWKPVQSGDLHFSDTDKVRSFIRNAKSFFHPEAYRLNTPASPHYAAELDGLRLDLENIVLPQTDNTLIVEGAGGLFVPLNERETVLDLIQHLKLPVILVSRNYLGSINHTMLSIEALKAKGVEIAGLIFNGERKASTEDWILAATGLPCIAKIENAEKTVDADFVAGVVEKSGEMIRKILIK